MNLVQPAMRRPLTIVVAIIAVALGSVLALRQMPRDIFPTLGIPTIYVAQPFGGMDPAQMEGYLTYYYEYHFLYITGIEHVESKSIQGASIIKLQFQPGTDMAWRSEEHTSELQSRLHLVCRLLLEKKKNRTDLDTVGKDDIIGIASETLNAYLASYIDL